MKISQSSETGFVHPNALRSEAGVAWKANNARSSADFGYDREEVGRGCFGLSRRRQRARLPRQLDGPANSLRCGASSATGRAEERPVAPRWTFDPGVPTCDFLEGENLDDPRDLRDAVANFTSALVHGEFLAWEAVVAQEQGLPLTRQQQSVLDNLIDLSESRDSRQVLYINGLARTSEPWHAILNRMLPCLLVEPFRTFEPPAAERFEAWRYLVACLEAFGEGLSLPAAATCAVEVIPIALRHKLWLQDCFEFLSGLGREDDLTLERKSQRYRVEDFVEGLRQHRDAVRYLNLTLDSLLAVLILPDRDTPIFLQAIQESLAMNSPTDRLADYL